MLHETHEESPALEPEQVLALETLLAGASMAEAAEAAGVHRTTLWRWLKKDFAFIAMLNAGRRSAQHAAQVRLESLADQALATVAQHVRSGDLKASLAVLQGLGILDGKRPAVGPDDPTTLHRRAAEAALFESIT